MFVSFLVVFDHCFKLKVCFLPFMATYEKCQGFFCAVIEITNFVFVFLSPISKQRKSHLLTCMFSISGDHAFRKNPQFFYFSCFLFIVDQTLRCDFGSIFLSPSVVVK